MKAYTDFEQSKKLEKILPIESADGGWYGTNDPFAANTTFWLHTKYSNKAAFSAWSITALLNLLPNEISIDDRFKCKYKIDIRKYDGGNNVTYYQIAYGNRLSGSWHDMINTGEKENLLDCCVQMILELHKLNLL